MGLDEEGGQYVRFVDHRQNTTALVVANAEGKLYLLLTLLEVVTDSVAGSHKKGLTWNDTTPFDFTQ